jgi:lysozyme
MRLFGPDVSHFQSEVDWAKVAEHGESFGACKATEGLSATDPRFAHNWAGMKKAGIDVRIAYHYGHTESSARGQADHFLSTVGPVAAGDVLCLDAEDVCEASKTVSRKKTATWVTGFLDRVVSVSGLSPHRVLVYTGQWWWDPRTGKSKAAASYPLWVSDYSNDPPHLPAGWKDYVLHQFTSKDHVPGVPTRVDRSSFNGSMDELRKLAGLNGVTVADPDVQTTFDNNALRVPNLDNLTFNARNEDVRALQAQLVARGFSVEVTGFYGDQTKTAVAAFQKSRAELDSDPDGLMGPVTLRLLFE